MKCIIPSCNNSSRKAPAGVSIHRFPKSEADRKLWLNALGLPDLELQNSSRICCVHFPKSHLIRMAKGNMLRLDAMPLPIKPSFEPIETSSSKNCAVSILPQKDTCAVGTQAPITEETAKNHIYTRCTEMASDFSAVHREMPQNTTLDSSTDSCKSSDQESVCEMMASDFSAIHRDVPNSILNSPVGPSIYEYLESDSESIKLESIKMEIEEDMFVCKSTQTEDSPQTKTKKFVTIGTSTGPDLTIYNMKRLDEKIERLRDTIKRKNLTIRNLRAKVKRHEDRLMKTEQQ